MVLVPHHRLPASLILFRFGTGIAKAKVFSTQKQLEVEAKQLQSSLQKYTKLSNQWISMVENFNQALKVNTSRYFVMMYDNAISFSITVVRADYILVVHDMHSCNFRCFCPQP